MRAPCDYCNGWFPKTFSALKVIMVAVVENKRKVNFKTISIFGIQASYNGNGSNYTRRGGVVFQKVLFLKRQEEPGLAPQLYCIKVEVGEPD